MTGERLVFSHRVAWELTNGPVPDGFLVLHKCDNPPCVRPDHLWLGTDLDNTRDKEAKGRGNQPRGERHASAKLTYELAAKIAAAYSNGGVSQATLAERYGVNQTMVSKIVRGKNWRPQ